MIVPNLWFDENAEEAAQFYIRVFKDGRVLSTSTYPQGSSREGTVMTVEFELRGQRFVGINGGPMFSFSEAVSFQIDCKDQAEIDYFWDALTDGGEESQCGWLKDRFGLSWQVVPDNMQDVFNDPDAARVQRMTQAMFTMQKIDVAALWAAGDG